MCDSKSNLKAKEIYVYWTIIAKNDDFSISWTKTIKRSVFYRHYNNDQKISVTYPLDQNFSRNPMVQLVFWSDHVLLVEKCGFIWGFLRLPILWDTPKWTVFYTKERGPIKKRVALSDSSKNFGLRGMSPKFFDRYCNACKKPIFSSSWFKKLKIRHFLP